MAFQRGHGRSVRSTQPLTKPSGRRTAAITYQPPQSWMRMHTNRYQAQCMKKPRKRWQNLQLSAILPKEAYLDGSSDTCACPLKITTNLGKFNLPPRPTPELLAVDDTNNNSKNNNEESFIDSDNNSLDDSSAQEGA